MSKTENLFEKAVKAATPGAIPSSRKPTVRQESALKRLARAEHNACPIDPSLVRQLVRHGWAIDTGHVHERVEWGRVIARLPVAMITSAGQNVIGKIL